MARSPRFWPPWPTPGEAASRLVQLAKEQGGHDNIAAVVFDVE